MMNDANSHLPSRCLHQPAFCREPAAICPLEDWLPDEQLQAIALENNLSETAYFVPNGDGYKLRCFTPGVEVDLCGHATLATPFIIMTARGTDVDFVARVFAPSKGVPEDPVTGSAHCTLIPYWADRLGNKQLHALQVSPRGGEIWCEHLGERVTMAGNAVRFLTGTIEV